MNGDTRPLMVTIQCITYNHEPYIRQCLEGFVMQKTNFRFEAIVHDDASTDGTAAIVREYAEKYPDIIKPIFETENQYSKHDGSLSRIMDEHTHGKYVALCEGDDYWIDSLKLQKQIDLLEEHEDCSFVYSGFNVVDQNSGQLPNHRFEQRMRNSHSGIVFFDLLVNMNFIMTLTTVFRKKVYDMIESYYYDYGYFLCAARMGLGIYLPDRTANYRINPTSIMNTAPQTLRPAMYPIILNELKRSLYNQTTSELITGHPLFKTVLGYIVVRNIRKSTQRLAFLKLALVNIQLYPYYLKSIFINLFCDKKFRKMVKSAYS